jgi:RimJ/RimL family protein N-acetyltransferase
MPPFAEMPEPLTDGVVALRLSAERDIPEILIAYQDDRELHLRLGIDRPPSGAELGRRSERAEAERETGRHVSLTVVEPGSDVCVGQITTSRVEWQQARAELGMWLAPQVRGRGLAGRALRLASLWFFETTALERLQITTEPGNEPMLATARAAGYQFEGVLRGYTLEQGRRVDCAVLSLLRADLADSAR